MRRRLSLLVLVIWAIAGAGFRSVQAADAPRLALVIGNAAYSTGKLPTAGNDAGLVAQSLAQDGFDVTAMADADADTVRRTIAAFTDKLKGAGRGATVFVYLSGYGAQYAGRNFFVPVGVKPADASDVPAAVVPLDEIEKSIEAVPAGARLIVYDLAREGPEPRSETSPFARGLAMTAAPASALVAVNAAPGMVARTDVPPYGLYARALAEMLRTPGLTARGVFARLRLRVAEITDGTVMPWEDGNLGSDVVLVPGDGVATQSRDIDGTAVQAAFWSAVVQDTLPAYRTFLAGFADSPLAARVKAIVAVRLEAATWRAAVRADSPAAAWTYMLRYPRGPHYIDVRRRLTALHASLAPPPRFDLVDLAGLPAPTPEQRQAVEKPFAPPDEAPEAPALPPVPETLLPAPPPAVWVELAPPPLVPRGALPIPTPFLIGSTRASLDVPGPILEPFVPGVGAITVQSGLLGTAAAMTLATTDGLVSRAVTSSDKAGRTIVETDAADEILSRTTVVREDGGVTITQIGPQGAVLSRIVTRIAQGERTTTVTNGADQLIAEMRTGPRGTIRDVTRGTGVADDGAFVIPAAEGRRDALPVAKPAPAPPSAAAAGPPVPPPDPTTPPPLPPSDLPAAPAKPASPSAPAVQSPAGPPSTVPPAPGPPPAAAAPAAAMPAPPAAADVPQPVPRPPANSPKGSARGAHQRGHR